MSVIDYPAGSTRATSVVLTDDSTQLQVTTGAATQSGVISQSGGAHGFEKIGAGTLVLTANETNTGTTTISAGALQVGNNGTAGFLGSGLVTDNAELTFYRSDEVTIANAISGSGHVTFRGTGGVTLTGDSTYTGGTTISEGALVLGGGSISNQSSGITTGSIVGDLVVGVTTANCGIVFQRSNNITFAGNISGLGYLAQYGTGTLTLTGNNSYGSTTDMLEGTLAFSSDSNLGAGDVRIFRGTVQFNAAFTSTHAYEIGHASFDTNGNNVVLTGNLSGLGSADPGLTKIGAGTLTLAGANPYGGPVVISAGSLQVGNGGTTGALSGTVTDNGNLIYDRSDAVALTRAVSGSGGLEQAGSGALAITVTQAYTGITKIDAGSTLSTSGTNIAASSEVNDLGTFDVSGGVSTTISALTGNGAVSLGVHTLTITAGNSGNFSGVIADAGLHGKVSLTGGTQILSGVNTYSGATTVNGGTLLVDGSILSSAATVASGATLGGTGTAGAVTIQSGGRLAAGDNGIGTLHINGDLTLQFGAGFLEDLSASSADETFVSGAATLSGTLAENFSGSGYTLGQTYTILHSTGLLSGGYTNITTSGIPAGLIGAVSYDAHNAYLTIQNGPPPPPPPPPAVAPEVAFISGVAADGTLPLETFSAWNPGTTPADYSGGYTNTMKWGSHTADQPGGTITYYFDPASHWTSTEQQALSASLALWSDIANISFVATTQPGAAQIFFYRGTNHSASTDPVASILGPADQGQTGSSDLLQMTGASISIDTRVAGFGPIDGLFSTYGGYVFDTMVHEAGHAIGLGHAGPYNGTANPQTQQFGPYDSRLWSIMSYIDPDDAAAYQSQYPVTANWGSDSASGAVPTTWMPLDILAAQALYGAPASTPLSGGQTFGFHSNIAGPTGMFFDFTKNTTPVITIWDAGGGNTLDLSGFSSDATVNLNPGTFSSTSGLINNIAIAYGTTIDTLISGTGSDVIQGNDDGDYIDGGGGNDSLTGGAGNDTLFGNTGSNLIHGAGGVNTFKAVGAKAGYTIDYGHDLVTMTGNGESDSLSNIQSLQFTDQTMAVPTLVTRTVASDVNNDGSSDILWQRDDGQASIWLMDGSNLNQATPIGSNPGPAWHAITTADFNGDGNADVLWQNDSGQAAVWLMNGTNVTQSAEVGPNPAAGWKIVGAGDFNGDHKSDILWQRDDGQAAVWLMDGLNVTQTTWVGPQPAAGWLIVGTGDFNGDNKNDILWQRDDGQAAIWLMDGTNVTQTTWVGPQPAPGWKIVATGDFDGDGKNDILWQRDSGQAAVWLMDGTTVTQTSWVGPQPAPGWNVVGAGDFDGDGKSDILWQRDNGQASVWLMNSTTLVQAAAAGPNPGTSWHIATG